MKYLQINSVCGIGSTGKIAVENHDKLLKEGHESYIAFGRGEAKDIEEKYTIKIGSKVDLYLNLLRTRLLDQHGLGSKSSTKEFLQRVREISPDVIHLHNIHGYYLNYPLLFKYLKEEFKGKVKWTLHDCWAFTGHCAYYDYYKCDKWKSQCGNCIQKKEYPQSLLLDNSTRNFNLKKESFLGIKDLEIITPSKWLANEVKNSFLKDYKIRVVYNTINTEIFKPRPSDFRKRNNLEEKFIILGVASPWSKRKGFKYFIELSKKLKEDEVIVMVGLNKKQLENLPKNILGIERTNNQIELAEIYTTADIFFNPTQEEVLGLTNLEAVACGTFGVTFNSGGSPECFDEKTGKVLKTKEIDEFLEIIKRRK